MNDSKLLTTEEVAQMLQLSPRTLEGWRRQGAGPTSLRIGNRVRYRMCDIDTWLTQNTQREAL